MSTGNFSHSGTLCVNGGKNPVVFKINGKHSIEGEAAFPAVVKNLVFHEVAVALKRYNSQRLSVLLILYLTQSLAYSLSLSHTHTHTHTYPATSPPLCVS